MGEFSKDPNQSGTGKQEQGDKPAFGQFEKGQQGQQDTGRTKEQFGADQSQAGQQFAEGKEQTGKPEAYGETKGDPQQQQQPDKGQRQQGDEDLGDDSIDNQSLK